MQLKLKLVYKSDYSAKRYFIGPYNEHAYKFLFNWPFDPTMGSFVFLCGEKGSGKTHLLNLWAKQFDACIVDPHTNKHPRDIVAIHDYFVFDNMPQDEVFLFHFYNIVRETNKKLLITNNVHPTIQLPDLRSRFATFYTIHLSKPDDITLEVVLKKMLADRGIRLSQRIIDHILKRVERSFLGLQTVVDKLDTLTHLNIQEIAKIWDS